MPRAWPDGHIRLEVREPEPRPLELEDYNRFGRGVLLGVALSSAIWTMLWGISRWLGW